MAGKKKGLLRKLRLANSKLELAVSLISAAVTIGSIAQKALEKSREYKEQEENKDKVKEKENS